MNKWLEIIINLVVFVICLGLVIVGQKTVGIKYILMQLIGLAGILVLIYRYNKKYQ